MNNLNIPLFRAEIIEDKRDEDYKKGFTIEVNNVKYAVGNYTKGLIEVEVDGQTRFFPIKKNTLSINFNDMQDSQGNKIFASLNEDGKGGDILDRNGITFKTIYKSVNGRFEAYEIGGMHHLLAHKFHQSKAIGIEK